MVEVEIKFGSGVPGAFVCDHCGRSRRWGGSVHGPAWGDGKTVYRLCHPEPGDGPDCYDLVSKRLEVLGMRGDGTDD